MGEPADCILVIDDDPSIRRVLETGLRARGYRAVTAESGERGLGAAAIEQPAVIVLDLGLPDLDGVEVCRRVRSWSTVPIIVLSAHGAEDRKIEALDIGADDFMTKPFSMRELLARVRVALRHGELRSATQPELTLGGVARVGALEVDLAARRVRVSGREVELTQTEFDILAHLVRNVGRVVTHDGLLGAVWGPGYTDDVHYLRVYVNRLRQKIEPEPRRPRLLVTLPRVGYRIDPPD